MALEPTICRRRQARRRRRLQMGAPPSAPSSQSGTPHGPVFSTFLTEWDATVATFSVIVGAALLSTPYAFNKCGFFAIPLMVFFTVANCFTAHLMAWTFIAQAPDADAHGIAPPMRSWPYLADAAFGVKAKTFLTGFLMMELWGYTLSYIVCTSLHMHQLVEQLALPTGILVSALLTYILTFAPPWLLSRVSVFSNALFFAGCFMFVVTGALLAERAPRHDFTFIKPSGILGASGILVFNSASHACYPSIMNAMVDPSRYPRCIRQAYTFALLFYLFVALPGYLTFGQAVEQSFIENIGRDRHLAIIPNLGWMSTFACSGIVLKMATIMPLVFQPLVDTIKFSLSPCAQEKTSVKVVLPIVILVLSVGVSMLFADAMSALINLIGSVLGMNIAFVIPVLCYWKLSQRELGVLEKLGLCLIMFMGLGFAILGVVEPFH